MSCIPKINCFVAAFLFCLLTATAQITITPNNNAQSLTQQLLGGGVSISNFSYTGANGAAGFFKVTAASPPLGIDSGIVFSTGYVQTRFSGTNIGINNIANDGTSGANRASSNLNRPGDANLATIIPQNYDAAVLEFDFVPTGDSIVFRYVFGSEEYPEYNCSKYNDVFAFFISGPGITGNKNIALVPNTNIPVAINSINNGIVIPSGPIGNNISYCNNMGPGSPFLQYYVDNTTSRYIAFNGFTKVLEAASAVQPCQTYHLKIAIADGFDRIYDSGVFLEAKSLRSSGLTIINSNPLSNSGDPYLAEGCTTGGIKIKRKQTGNFSQQVSLVYGGTATNGTDVTLLPAVATIAANDSFVYIPIVPIADHLPEGIEKLKIYVSGGCINNINAFSDSIEIQIRDYDTLGITPKDSTGICKGSSLQLSASAGYSNYTWQPIQLLSNPLIHNPVAVPITDGTTFICQAVLGSCEAKDSVKLSFKKLLLVLKQDVVCKNAGTGQIKVATGWQWQKPLEFWINNRPRQTDSSFSNLSMGTYQVKVRDASGCTDSIAVTINQLFPDLTIDSTAVTYANCTDTATGLITISAGGGKPPFVYSADGGAFQPLNIFQATVGSHFVVVKDANTCTDTALVLITYNNAIQIDAGSDTTICEGDVAQLHATSNAASVLWSPVATISNPVIVNPVVNPIVTTVYIITASNANCFKKDSITVQVYPAPVPNAGRDTAVCTGGTVQLNGSGGISYRWSPPVSLNNALIANPIATINGNITYSLNVTDQYNCASLRADEVFVRAVPSVKVFAGNDTVAAVGQPLQLLGRQLNDTSAKQYTWTPATGLSNPAILNPVATLFANQTYRLLLRTPQGCQGYDDITIKVYNGPEIYVPGGFTPNGDGRNDVLHAIAVGIKTFKYFNIYNRWGQLVFRTTISERGWDGKINGILQSNQSFVWIAEGIGYNDLLVKRQGSVVVIP